MLTQAQRYKLDLLRHNQLAREEFRAAGGVRKSKLSLDKGEETITQWMHREMRTLIDEAYRKEYDARLGPSIRVPELRGIEIWGGTLDEIRAHHRS